MPTTGLLTDQYELTMVQAALRDGTADRPSVFELYGRRLPDGRRYGIVAGVGRALEALADFRFEDDDLEFLRSHSIVDGPTLEWLAGYRFTGCVWGYGEGDAYFPGSPILIVEAAFAEAVLLETLFLSIYNHDSAIASAASRMILAADGRPCIEMGSRRTHERSAVAAARAAYIAGFASTSNLRAGADYGVPTAGTAAHAFTLVHDTERDAFIAQVESLGAGTTLLVDTYDVRTAVALAVEVAGTELGAVRLDSGDLAELAHEVRRQLDALGATSTRIIVTSDLDEFAIAGLAVAPVDGYGVGTSPRDRLWRSDVRLRLQAGRAGLDPRRHVDSRRETERAQRNRRRPKVGAAAAEPRGHRRGGGHRNQPSPRRRRRRPALLRELVRDGEVIGQEPLPIARDRHRQAVAELPAESHQLQRGEPAIPTEYVGA